MGSSGVVWRRKISLIFARPWKHVTITMAAKVQRAPMPRKATAEEAAQVNDILSRVTYDGSPHFATTIDWQDAVALSKVFSGYVPPSNCSSCRHHVHDNLRAAVGLGVARRPLKDAMVQERLTTCRACRVYSKYTDSCGTVILDAIRTRTVMVDNTPVHPCGCIISLKAKFQTEECPGGFWNK